jgi:phage-related protein
MKQTGFLGNTRSVIRSFPDSVRWKIGGQLWLVQTGFEPDDWKPMPSIGPGVKEIRVRDISGAYRVIYLASFAEHVFVLNAFIKKTQSTPRREIELARKRLKELK